MRQSCIKDVAFLELHVSMLALQVVLVGVLKGWHAQAHGRGEAQ